MEAGIGLDLVEVRRIERLTRRWGRQFLDRIFTEGELASVLGKRKPAEHLAARFAAKEALLKAANLLPCRRWREIEVRNRPSGEPYFSKLPEGLEPERVKLSLTHAAGVAVAIVLIESRGGEEQR